MVEDCVAAISSRETALIVSLLVDLRGLTADAGKKVEGRGFWKPAEATAKALFEHMEVNEN